MNLVIELYSVKEKLPEFMEPVVIFSGSKEPRVSCYIRNPQCDLVYPENRDKGIWVTFSYSGYAVVLQDKITHWMRLPNVKEAI